MAKTTIKQMISELKEFCKDYGVCRIYGVNRRCPIYNFTRIDESKTSVRNCEFSEEDYGKKDMKKAYNLMQEYKEYKEMLIKKKE